MIILMGSYSKMMKNKIFRNGLIIGVIFLFLGIAVQPITSVDIEQYNNSKQVETIKQSKDIDPEKYLFDTIIQVANNPEFKDLMNQNKIDILSYDYDFNDVFKQLLFKNSMLFYSMIFTKPSFTYEFLDKSYSKGIEFVNIIGEDQALEIMESIRISNPVISNELNNIITVDNELSSRLSTLKELNINLKPDAPFQYYPIICGVLLTCFNVFSGIAVIFQGFTIIFENFYLINKFFTDLRDIFFAYAMVCYIYADDIGCF